MFRKRKKRYLKVILCLGILLTITSSYAMWDRLSDTATATIKLETQIESSAAQEPVKAAVKSKNAESINESTHETKEKKVQTESTDQGSNQAESPMDSTVE